MTLYYIVNVVTYSNCKSMYTYYMKQYLYSICTGGIVSFTSALSLDWSTAVTTVKKRVSTAMRTPISRNMCQSCTVYKVIKMKLWMR